MPIQLAYGFRFKGLKQAVVSSVCELSEQEHQLIYRFKLVQQAVEQHLISRGFTVAFEGIPLLHVGLVSMKDTLE